MGAVTELVRCALPLALGLLLLSCEPQPPEGTGGAVVEESFGPGGRSCGRGIAVGMTDPNDYASTNIALVGLDGATLSGSFLSSGSADPSLNAALSGDVVFPSERMKGPIVLIDRFVNSVLTFVDVETGRVEQQLSVRTGFESNPQDFIELDGGGALVSRLEQNSDAGQEPFDGGDDLLRVRVPPGEVIERIDLSVYLGEATQRARPTRMVRRGDFIFLALTRLSADFQEADEGEVGVLDAETGELLGGKPVSGLKNCGGLAVSPDASRLAITCGGLLYGGDAARPPASGVVVWRIEEREDDAAVRPPLLVEEFRLTAEELGYGPLAPTVSFATARSIWLGTFGAVEGDDAGRPDRVVAVDLQTGEFEAMLESSERAFTLGDVRCIAPCGLCFVADAGRGVLHRFAVSGQDVSEPTRHVVETEIGLPPLFLGWF